MRINIKKSKDGQFLTVFVETDERRPKGDKKRGFTMRNALAYLRNKGFDVVECIRNDTVVNYHPNRMSGSWIFRLKVEKPKQSRKVTKPNRDKSEKSV